MVPDQRGYNLSSKPKETKAYRIENLSNDIAQLISKLGSQKVYLVGHDWGGAVAWAVAIRFPQLLGKTHHPEYSSSAVDDGKPEKMARANAKKLVHWLLSTSLASRSP